MEQKDRVFYNMKTHLEMLRDRVRCFAYQRALAPLVRDKVVLDVGSGSGILSFFAAGAGAKLVLAVDIDVPPGAEEIARANGLADRIQFLSGNIRDIVLPIDAVDVIISEWMGGLLLMEDMLPSVLYARDRWLKPGGLLLPDRARLFLVPLGDVAGIDSKRYPSLREMISSQVWVGQIDPSRFLAGPSCILDLDLNTIQEPDTKFYRAPFHFVVNESGILNGFGLWFDVLFSKTVPPVLLSTAPWLPPTHWGQGLWIIPGDIDVNPGNSVSGIFTQTKISPSTASFQTEVSIDRMIGEKMSFCQSIEAAPSNMNPPGNNEEHIAGQVMSGAYIGQECLWIGCSMSFAILAAAKNGAKNVAILNHSSWAASVMRQLADQDGLTNVLFLSEVPMIELSQNKDIHLLGTADASWQALLSHIKARTALGQASFPVRFYRLESPWKEFYGFDFSAYAPYDLGMAHEEKVFSNGIMLDNITGRVYSPIFLSPEPHEIIYTGLWINENNGLPAHPNGSYNCMKVSFHCGTIVLPLPGLLDIDSKSNKQLQKVELIISILNNTICKFLIRISCRGWFLEQGYEQPLSSMGHIVHKP